MDRIERHMFIHEIPEALEAMSDGLRGVSIHDRQLVDRILREMWRLNNVVRASARDPEVGAVHMQAASDRPVDHHIDAMRYAMPELWQGRRSRLSEGAYFKRFGDAPAPLDPETYEVL